MEYIRNDKVKFEFDRENRKINIYKFNEIEDEYEFYDYTDINYDMAEDDFISYCNNYKEL